MPLDKVNRYPDNVQSKDSHEWFGGQGTNFQLAYLAMGCFWGAQKLFWETPGIVDTEVGYMGGEISNPTYQQVCNDTTGHAETVRIFYDPAVIPYQKVLELFFTHHDPTTLNRQGPDVGSQYRSALFPVNLEQQEIAEDFLSTITPLIVKKFGRPPVTQITSHLELPTFYLAEDYHQFYLHRNPQASCSLHSNGLSCF